MNPDKSQTIAAGNRSDAERVRAVAAVHLSTDRGSAVAWVVSSGLSAAGQDAPAAGPSEQRRFAAAEFPALRAWLRERGVGVVIRVAPNAQVLVRTVKAPEEVRDRAALASAMELLAESELPAHLPWYRRTGGVVPGSSPAALVVVSGAIAVALTRRPSFSASLRADRINLDAYLPPAEAGSDPAASPGPTSPGPTAGRPNPPSRPPLALLRDFDANLDLRVDHLSDRRAPGQRFRLDPAPVGPSPSELDLTEPVESAWTIGTIGVAYDEPADRIVVLFEELTDQADEPDGPDDDPLEPVSTGASVRVRLTREQAAAFVRRGRELVTAGRPPCRFCGFPVDPDGHACPRMN